ncbi:hypothetical protein HYH03_004406 [Edaphochlamys debaryana]|uniref:Methyltransferase FkbM domain-containing protein n=1 Tax=Edaphochlamys debaryana TaxID=47281 RepID=A0A836C3C2_9CHLO|nr:hypothetical protein HYH03_004406 [Edaphochlamys debaryana]|eukprot:KAG2497667.1 hypothetical protein HYH03_004406 [Edaphochlamys debaryana]
MPTADGEARAGRSLRRTSRRWLCSLLASTACAILWSAASCHGRLIPGLPVRQICTNSCNLAKNGVCEEGRLSKNAGPEDDLEKPVVVYCDLGTDCDDCGPWNTTAPAAATYWEDPTKPGPIRFLRSKDVQVRVRATGIPLLVDYDFAYTDPTKDVDVSHHMEANAIVEAQITKVFYWILKHRCKTGKDNLFVDVGANFGWFAVLAAKLGCRVIAYEPVPLFRWFLEYNVHVNDLMSRIDIRAVVVSQERDRSMTMVVPTTGIWGTAGIDGLNIDKSIEGKKEEIDVPSVRLEDEVKEDVLLMKVDVEGWEYAVIQGAEGLLSKYNVENIVMEYSPGVAERHWDFPKMNDTVLMLVDLMHRYGYQIGHIGEGKYLLGPYDQPPEPMWGVSLDNLKYDYTDVQLWKAHKLGCPTHPELFGISAWDACFGVPEALSPRSLRSILGHNTNLWLTKGESSKMLVQKGLVGILDPNDPPTKYFQTNMQFWGMGARRCYHLDPKVQVKHRCNCTRPEVCGTEQAIVDRLAIVPGAIPQNYVLGDAKQVLGLK